MTPQESRERFEKFIETWGYKYAIKDEVMFEVDTYTHSLITHAMQQIEAGKIGKHSANLDAAGWVNSTKDEDLHILQSLLPEQKKEV